ncbi:MAG: IS66-like element accessory protein TnpA [Rubrivivax sp.]|jgi:transposase
MSDVDTNGGKPRRRNKRWPVALKREIVAATYLPGATVSVVARQYDVNANQVFRWRRLAEKSGLPTPSSSCSSGGLIPVTIAPEPSGKPAPVASETIEIEVGVDCRVRVGSSFDGRALKRVLDVLRKR